MTNFIVQIPLISIGLNLVIQFSRQCFLAFAVNPDVIKLNSNRGCPAAWRSLLSENQQKDALEFVPLVQSVFTLSQLGGPLNVAQPSAHFFLNSDDGKRVL